jgi:TRAP-type C4-dicarboxylate transport system permease small subunit
MLLWVQRINRAVTAVLEPTVILLFFVLFVLVAVLVILRYVFGSTIAGGDEMIEYLFIYTSTVGAALVLARREHVSIPVFWGRMKASVRRTFDTVNHLLIILLNAYMLLLSREWIAGVGAHRSYMLHLPMWVVQISIPIGCGLTILYCLVNIVGGVPADRDGGTP